MQKELALSWITEKEGKLIEGPFNKYGRIMMRVMCGKGHEWESQIGNLARKHWCAACYGNAPLTIADMQAVAASRGGKCRSELYGGLKTALEWECVMGHVWTATPNNVKSHGSWCPECHIGSSGELLARETLHEAFPGKLFNRSRRIEGMEGLELDCVNMDLMLAIEYNGIQHYMNVPNFHREEGDFEAQLDRDARKQELCDAEGITLIIVPYTIPLPEIRDYLRGELDTLYDLAPKEGTDIEFMTRVFTKNPNIARYENLCAFITKKGGECLTDTYLGYNVLHKMRCRYGHEFVATPAAIDQPDHRGPRFCPECGGTRRQSDEELREKVEACGFEYLGVYTMTNSQGKARRRITVKCPQGHQYEVLWDNFSPTNNVPKKGCSACHHNHLGNLKRTDPTGWAAALGFTVSGYQRLTVKCDWTCRRGHVFNVSLKTMQDRASHAKPEMCKACTYEDFAERNSLTLITPWVEGRRTTDVLTWICSTCTGTFTRSFERMGKPYTCSACKRKPVAEDD